MGNYHYSVRHDICIVWRRKTSMVKVFRGIKVWKQTANKAN